MLFVLLVLLLLLLPPLFAQGRIVNNSRQGLAQAVVCRGASPDAAQALVSRAFLFVSVVAIEIVGASVAVVVVDAAVVVIIVSIVIVAVSLTSNGINRRSAKLRICRTSQKVRLMPAASSMTMAKPACLRTLCWRCVAESHQARLAKPPQSYSSCRGRASPPF